MVTSFLAQ